MKLSINREKLLTPLQSICNVVERRQTLAILANVLLEVEGTTLKLTGTDLEVEMIAKLDIDSSESSAVTLPARKLLDICKALPDSADISIKIENGRAEIRSGRSRFILATLGVEEFPALDALEDPFTYSIEQGQLKYILDKTQFSMAQQDVRYYLNGLLLEFDNNLLRAVATDGHRLAMCEIEIDLSLDEKQQVIIPRKGVTELSRLLRDSTEAVEIQLAKNHIKFCLPDIIFTSKLIDGNFPDYQKVIPQNLDIAIECNRGTLYSAFQRASVLSNEKYRGMRLKLSENLLTATVHNPEQEEAEEEMEISYTGNTLEIGFNVSYFLDALNAIEHDSVIVNLLDANSSCLLHTTEDSNCKYVIMPMRL